MHLDLQASIDVIRSVDPDIIGMQEIDRFWARSAYLDEPAALGEALGLPHTYAPNLDHPADTHSPVPHQYGTVILSRFPILGCTNTLLPCVGTTEQRGLTRAVIVVRGVSLQFFNTHLHTVQADRLLQTAAIAEVLDAAPEGPKILVGDFNARSTLTDDSDRDAADLRPAARHVARGAAARRRQRERLHVIGPVGRAADRTYRLRVRVRWRHGRRHLRSHL